MPELNQDVMKAPSQIEKEIGQLQRRREALAADVTGAQRELEKARQGLISGQADVSQVTSAQAAFTTLNEVQAGLEARLTELRGRLAEAQASAGREERIGLLLHHAREADEARRDYQAAQLEMNEELTRLAARMNEAHGRWEAAQNSWYAEAKPLAEGVSVFAFMRRDQTRDIREMEAEADALISELEGRGGNLDAVLAEYGTRQRSLAITRRRPPVEVEPFGGMMPTILTVAAKHASQQARQDADAGEQRGVMVAGSAF